MEPTAVRLKPALALLLVAASVALAVLAFREPDRLLRSAEEALAASDLPRAEDRARATLAAEPLDGRAYRVLARVAAASKGTADRIARLVNLAVTFAPRDLEARLEAARVVVLMHGDLRQALGHYDRALRVEPAAAIKVFEVLDQFAADARGQSALAAILVAQPPWREAYVQHAAQALPVPVLKRLVTALPQPLTRPELAAYLDRLVHEGQFDEAYLTWVEALPPALREHLASPADGDFEWTGGVGGPFEWQLTDQPGVEASVAALAGGSGHALRVVFTGRRAQPGVRTLMMLVPDGVYRLRWQAQMAGLDTPQGLHWVIRCADASASVLTTTVPVRGSSPWADYVSDPFTVPAGCPAQWLSLELAGQVRADSEAYGSAWFDALRVEPVP